MRTLVKDIRLSRILRDNKRSLIVAMDHPIHFWIKELPGLANPDVVMKAISDGGADAILASPGVLLRYAAPFARKLGLIAAIPSSPVLIEEMAILGADAIKTTHFLSPEEIRNNATSDLLMKIAIECAKWGLPYVCEIVPSDPKTGELILNEDEIAIAARVAAEAGADIVKTAFPGSVEGFKKVVSVCPVPVVILGGAKTANEEELLTMVKHAIEGGGAGVAMGRNIWRHAQPKRIVEAIAGIIHKDQQVAQMMKLLTG